MAQHLLAFNGRPCEIISSSRRRHRNPNWGFVHIRTIRYLDGRAPAREDVTAGKLKRARVLSGTEATVWRRVDDLIREGMGAQRALEQARAEVAKGIGAPALF